MSTFTTVTEIRAALVARSASRGHERPAAASEAPANDVVLKLLERMEQLESANLALRSELHAATGRYTEICASTATAVEGTMQKLFEELQEVKATALEQASKLKELEAASKTHRHTYGYSGHCAATGTTGAPS